MTDENFSKKILATKQSIINNFMFHEGYVYTINHPDILNDILNYGYGSKFVTVDSEEEMFMWALQDGMIIKNGCSISKSYWDNNKDCMV